MSLVGIVALLGACGSVEADLSPPDAMSDAMEVSGDAAPADGGDGTSAVSFRATQSATVANATSLVIPRPPGLVGGDLLLAHVSNRNHVEATIAPPEGWTEIRSDQSAFQLKSWLLWKVVGDEEPGEYAFEISVASNAAGTIVAFSGADPVTPIDAASGQRNGKSAEFITPPLTTTSSAGLAVWFGAQLWPASGCTSGQITPPEGFAGIAEVCLSAQSTGILLQAATLSLGDAGPQPAWVGSSPYPETNTAQAVALRPMSESSSAAR